MKLRNLFPQNVCKMIFLAKKSREKSIVNVGKTVHDIGVCSIFLHLLLMILALVQGS